jgi:hypothetical protein
VGDGDGIVAGEVDGWRGLIRVSCNRGEAEGYHERESKKRCFHYIPPLVFFAETRNRFAKAAKRLAESMLVTKVIQWRIKYPLR